MMFGNRQKHEAAVSSRLSRIRLLTDAEMLLVSGGGEGGACSASDCAASATGDDGAVGTLSEVTVSASQDSAIGIGPGGALANQIDLAMTDPAMAMFMFMSLIGNASFPSLSYPTIPVNPMGDPSPGGP